MTQVNTTQLKTLTLTTQSDVAARTTNTKLLSLTKQNNIATRSTQLKILALESSTSLNPKVYTTQSNAKILQQTASASPPTYTTNTVMRVLHNVVTDVSTTQVDTTQTRIMILEQVPSTPIVITEEVVDYADGLTTSFRNGRAVFLTSRRTYGSRRDGFATKTKEQFDEQYADRYEDTDYYGAS